MVHLKEQPDLEDLSKGQKWILRLLYTPEKDQSKNYIEGRTRLVKGLFLIDKMFDEKFSDFSGTGYTYKAHKYGPFDQSIYSDLEQLEELGLVRESDVSNSGSRIEFSESGELLAERAYQKLPPDYKKHLSWIKRKHVQQPVAQLLSFVYNRYPETAENSEFSN